MSAFSGNHSWQNCFRNIQQPLHIDVDHRIPVIQHQRMLAILKENDITRWRTRFVDALLAARESG